MVSQFLQSLSSADGEQGSAYITSIDWGYNDLTSQSLCHLPDIPAHFLRHLKKLYVFSNKLDRTAVSHIAKAIPQMPQLEVLDLWNNPNIQRGGAVSFLSALCDQRSLKSLGLSRTNIGDKDCEQLVHLLPSTKCLYVSENSFSSNCIHILFSGLKENSSIETLWMKGTSKHPQHISQEAIKTFNVYLQDKKCKLKSLNLEHCDISPSIAVELAHGLSRNCSLKDLYLSKNPIGDEGAVALVTHNKTVTDLRLAECDITTTGGAALASSLMVNSKLTCLDIGGNSLGEAIPTLTRALHHNKTLKRLYLAHDNSLNQSDMKQTNIDDAEATNEIQSTH